MNLPHSYDPYVEPALKAADHAAVAVAIATVMQWITHGSAVVAFIWLCLRIFLAIEEIRLKRAERKKIENETKGA